LVTLGAQQAGQASAQKQDPPGETRKVAAKVWTNDDFPPPPVVQPAQVPQPATTKPKESVQSKKDDARPADPLTEKFLKMSPEERQKTITDDQSELKDLQDGINALRSSVSQASDDAQYQQALKQIAQYQKGQEVIRHELEILRKLPQPETQKDDSLKANPQSTSDTKTKPDSGSSSNQP
jgi:hypothetical protein